VAALHREHAAQLETVGAQLGTVGAQLAGAEKEYKALLAGAKGEFEAKLVGAGLSAEVASLRVLKDYGVSVAGGEASKDRVVAQPPPSAPLVDASVAPPPSAAAPSAAT
jgi:hypothetical protein